jgi:BolA protein
MNAAPGPVAKRIREKLEGALAPQSLEVIDESHLHAGHAGSRSGGESHFRVKVVSEGFVGKSLLERHRKVNEALADELKPDGVHALAIEAHAPGE